FLVLLGLLIVATFAPVVFGAQTFFFRDFGLFGYPLAHFQRECFWRGEWPLWNPLSACGLPFLAQWNTLGLYPPALFYLVFPLSWSLGVFCILHLALGSAGMFVLARQCTANGFAATMAGLLFGFNGLSLHCLMWPNNIAALGWMPWVISSALRLAEPNPRAVLRCGFIGALQMLSGAPEIILFTWLAATVLCLPSIWPGKTARPMSRFNFLTRFLVAVFLVVCLSAAQLLPFIQLLAESHRSSSSNPVEWPMPPWGWANFLVPLFYTFRSFSGVHAQWDQYWTSSYYLPMGGVLIAICAVWQVRNQRVWLLGALIFFSLLMALGPHAPLYPLIQKLFPALTWIRYPIKFVVLAIWALPLLAAFGVARWQRRLDPSDGGDRRVLIAVAVFMAAGILAILLFDAKSPFPTEDPRLTFWNGITRLVFLALTVALMMTQVMKPSWLVPMALVLLVWLDALTHMPRQNPTAPRWIYDAGLVEPYLPANPRPAHGQSRAFVTPAAQNEFQYSYIEDPTRFYPSRRAALYSNCNLLEGMPKVNGFFSLYPKHLADVQTLLYAATNTHLPGLNAFLGVSHRTSSGNLFEWETEPGFLPLITGGQRPSFRQEQEIPILLQQPQFDPAVEVFLPMAVQKDCSVAQASQVKIESTRFNLDGMECDAIAEAPALIVIAQTHFPSWKAYLDGKRVPLWRANHAFQCLEIPAGKHHLEVRYEDGAFKLGGLISVTALGLCMLLAIRNRSTR
ncbi:MAG: hypothetical protein AB1813_06210, partial [Verrucomicrobiota bacterium]